MNEWLTGQEVFLVAGAAARPHGHLSRSSGKGADGQTTRGFAWAALCCTALVPSMVGCTTSLRAYERHTVYFERCYGADHDQGVETPTRLQCWSRWLKHYSSGQPSHRKAYAHERLRQLRTQPKHAQTAGRALIDGPLGSRPSPTRCDEANASNNPRWGLAWTPTQTHRGSADPRSLPYCQRKHTSCSKRCACREKECRRQCDREQSLCEGAAY